MIFPSEVDGAELLSVLQGFCVFYKQYFASELEPYLDEVPETVGLTFGIEKGRLFPMRLFGKEEYVGRPLVVASRLQGSIKNRDTRPAHKVLTSKAVFKEHFSEADKTYKVINTERDLRNIGKGSGFECKKICLLEKPKAKK